MDRSRLAILAGLTGALGALGLALLAPERLQSALASVEELATTGVGRVPIPVLVAGALLVGVVLWVVVVRYLLGLCYRLWRRSAARVYWALTLVLPESPLVKFAAGTMVLIAATIVIVGGLPMLVGNLGAADAGAAGYVNEMSGQLVNTEWDDIVDGDAVGGEPDCDGSVARVDGGTTDRDQDGLPDAWERAGETPRGAALPGADPARKDLYVQVNYGQDVAALTDAERRQLRESWATMPVSNPDGTDGVTLHLDDGSARAGDLGEPAVITAMADRNAYYTAERLGPRRCVYRQVVFGKVQVGDVAGVASTPGYSAFVDGAPQPAYEGDVSFRVAVTNHELLHATAGRVDGQPHTGDGWLAGGPENEYLSRATAADLTESGLYGPAS